MFDYHAANDEIIIARSHDGDDAATDFLLEKYRSEERRVGKECRL